MVIPQDRTLYLELAKIANARNTLTSTLLRVYLMNMVRAYRREEAAVRAAAIDKRFEN